MKSDHEFSREYDKNLAKEVNNEKYTTKSKTIKYFKDDSC